LFLKVLIVSPFISAPPKELRLIYQAGNYVSIQKVMIVKSNGYTGRAVQARGLDIFANSFMMTQSIFRRQIRLVFFHARPE